MRGGGVRRGERGGGEKGERGGGGARGGERWVRG